MSSLVERLRVRSDKRPRYDCDDSDDDFDSPVKGGGGGGGKSGGSGTSRREVKRAKRVSRPDATKDLCQRCKEGGNLMSCSSCTYAFHKKCLVPRLITTAGDNWSCPECVSPLTEIEKILDCEKRPVPADTTNPEADQKQVLENYYLIKWKGLSYLHCSWVSESEFSKASKNYPRLKTRLSNFHKQNETVYKSDDDWVPIRPEWTEVDRIIAFRKPDEDEEVEYFVKWKELGYDECTWEAKSKISAFQPEIERFKRNQSRCKKKISSKVKKIERKMCTYSESPEFLSGGNLHPYQLEGLNFLRFSWAKNRRVILADEMGLGKTIQTIAFLASLFEDNHYPFLVVGPLSTLRNWEREFATWAPQMNVVVYGGSSQAREMIRKYEFYYHKKDKKVDKSKKKVYRTDKQKKQLIVKFDVLLTSYEMINMDTSVLKTIKWECMVVDEGHRLKNKESKLFGQLKDYPAYHRVLLTGTPLQNNLDELFVLMHFLEGETFGSIEDLQEEFKDINQDKQVEKLHGMLKPHLLRRFKKDVLKELPPKKELILRVELTAKQKEYYKAILTRNFEVLTRRGGQQISLMNVVMELRKLCCHALMLEGVEPVGEQEILDEGLRQLLDASGKMQLLDKMMVTLKEQGHRVLIYSQFQHMLDILEDYLIYKKWNYERIDGTIGGAERQIRIDRFNANNSNRFCFLLSTRAGGLGINLATADTVIIYDSDWNPHADLQAMARAHRLGQTSKVMIFRLICRGTIEERMMQLARKKMILEHLVVGRHKADNVNQEQLDDIIRYGSKELFADEDDEVGKARQIHYDDAAIERLLNRDQVHDEEDSDYEDDDDFFEGFKVADFEYIDESKAADAKDELLKQSDQNKVSNSERANYWEDLLRDRYEVQKIEEHVTMGKGKRNRRQMNAINGGEPVDSSDDNDSCYDEDQSDTESNAQGSAPGRKGLNSKKTSSNIKSIPLIEHEGKSFRVYGFNQVQRAAFAQALLRFGFQDYKWKDFIPQLRGKSCEEIEKYGNLVITHLLEEPNDLPNFADGVPKEGLHVDDVLVRIAQMSLIEEKVDFISKEPGASLFPHYIFTEFPILKSGRIWKFEHDLSLLKAVLKHGFARWQAIVEDKINGLSDAVRQALHLPSVTEKLGDAQASNVSNENVEASSKGSQVPSDRDVNRRIVEFIKRRYNALEKALDIEHAVKISNLHVPDDPKIDPVIREDRIRNIQDTSLLLKDLPPVNPISDNEAACGNSAKQQEVQQLYNKMCGLVDASDPVALRAHLGDKPASGNLVTNISKFESLWDDVDKVLNQQPPTNTGMDLDGASA